MSEWHDRRRQPCGTPAAYRRHLRQKTKVCPPCLAAHKADEQRWDPALAQRARNIARSALARRHPEEYETLRRAAVRALRAVQAG